MNIIDYVQSNNKRFAEEPFNHVDALILCELIYCNFDAVVREENVNLKYTRYCIRDFFKGEYFDRMFPVPFTAENDRILLTAVAASPRFRDIRVKYIEDDFNPDVYKQFAVGIFGIDKDTDFVAFRGTDSSIVGWKEDFNLSFMNEVPSQREALRVINSFYKNSWSSAKNIIIGGHSKGGNLAVYAASFAAPGIRERITRVYSMDGPGFREEVKKKMREIKPDLNIVKIVPEKSFIGMLMETGDDYLVVESNAFFILQHAAYNWKVEGNDFKYADNITRRETVLNNTIYDWLMHASDAEREVFVDAVFGIMEDNDIEYTSDFMSTDIRGMIQSTRALNEEQDYVIKKLLGELLSAGIRQKSAGFRENLKNKIDHFTE